MYALALSKPGQLDNDGCCNNKKRSHTQLDSRKQVIAFQDRVITINIKEAQHPLRFTQSDLNVVLRNEGRDYSQHFQTYKFYFSMRMTFINQGDSLVYVGDLLNLHGEALDDVFERVFRSCINGVNLQHFNRNQLVDLTSYNLHWNIRILWIMCSLPGM